MAAGGIAGMVSCLYWVAPDTLKTRVQTGRYRAIGLFLQ